MKRFVETLVAGAVAALILPVEHTAHAESEQQFCEVEELEIELTPPRDCLGINVESQAGYIWNDCEARVDLEDWPIDPGRDRDLTLYPGEQASFQLPYSDEFEDGTYPFDLSLALEVAGEPTALEMTGVAECRHPDDSIDPGGEGCSAGGSAPGGLAAVVLLIAICVARRRRDLASRR